VTTTSRIFVLHGIYPQVLRYQQKYEWNNELQQQAV